MLAIIQCRLGSERFPQKALADLGGKPLIRHVVDRVSECRLVSRIVVAVPMGDVGQLEAHLGDVEVVGPRIPEDNVLGRFRYVAERYPDHDTIMRVTGDCPLWSPVVGELVAGLYLAKADTHYAWNISAGYTDGEDTEVFSRAALLDADEHATDDEDREHVTSWIRRHYGVETLSVIDRPTVKTSVDSRADLERVRWIYGEV